ncbi:MAG: hypothetical protein ACRDOS_00635 [Gaiellaceae bacterium]
MTPTRKSTAARWLEDASGREVLERALEQGHLEVVEAFWRYRDAGLAAIVADCILRADHPALTAMVVDEIVDSTMADPLPAEIVTTLSQHQPRLPESATRRLAARLRDEVPFPQNHYETGRGVLERWVIEQESSVAADLALAAVKQETPASASNQTVREGAYLRCASDPKLLKAAAAAMVERTETTPTRETWIEVTTFLDRTSPGAATVPPSLEPLLDWLVEQAPRFAQSTTFPDALENLVANAARLVVVLGGEALPDTPGSGALLRAIETIDGARDRTRAFATAAAHQPHLWRVLAESMPNWDESEWKRRLAALGSADGLQQSVAAYIVDNAPATISVEIVAFALKQARQGPDDPLLQRVGQSLHSRIQTVVEDDEAANTQAQIDAIRWPRKGDSGETRQMFKAVLDAALGSDPVLATQLILGARQRDLIGTTDVAFLIPDDQVENAFEFLGAGAERGALAIELIKDRDDEVVQAASGIQQRAFALDIAEALAPSAPDAAFAGGAEAWVALSASEKDELTKLVVSHGAAAQQPILETIVGDVHRNNAARRAQATAAIAELTPEGGTLPPGVVDLLTSGRPELRRAGIQAIGKVKPRDQPLIGHLREIAAGGGQLGREATQVLDDLSSIFTSELAAASSRSEVSALLPLLGAVGRPAVINPLLGYVGPDAEYDDKDIHRLAASALRSACGSVLGDITPEQQAALVALLEGESQEVDQQARADLSAALANVALGEDVALASLYDEIGFDPGIAPAVLYGDEKDWIFRHAGLWAKERDRGQSGRPGQLENLDIISERLTRAAYLEIGDSENIKSQIRADETKPDYGALITALGSTKLSKQVANLQTLHDLRCNRTFAHIGTDPTDQDMVRANASFKDAAKAIIGVLKAVRSARS